jgi:hypothetical protein
LPAWSPGVLLIHFMGPSLKLVFIEGRFACAVCAVVNTSPAGMAVDTEKGGHLHHEPAVHLLSLRAVIEVLFFIVNKAG